MLTNLELVIRLDSISFPFHLFTSFTQTLVSTVWRFVTRTREWVLLPAPMSRPRAKHASCGFKSKLFVFGGISPVESAVTAAEAQASGMI